MQNVYLDQFINKFSKQKKFFFLFRNKKRNVSVLRINLSQIKIKIKTFYTANSDI